MNTNKVIIRYYWHEDRYNVVECNVVEGDRILLGTQSLENAIEFRRKYVAYGNKMYYVIENDGNETK